MRPNSNSRAGLVSILDDDESLRSSMADLLMSAGQSFASAEEFLTTGALKNTACVITDVCMPGMSGFDLQSRLAADKYSIPMIFITAHADGHFRARALRAGAVEFLSKPFDEERLLKAVQAALAEYTAG